MNWLNTRQKNFWGDKMEIIDLRVDGVVVGHNYIILSWSANIGFGELTLHKDDEEGWVADTECMGADFVKCVLSAWVNTMKVK